jgi:hypothetical protein
LLDQVARRTDIAPTPEVVALRLTEARLLLAEGRAADAASILGGAATYWGERRPGSRWHGEAEYWLAKALASSGQSAASAAARDRARATLRTSRGFPLDATWRRELVTGARPAAT